MKILQALVSITALMFCASAHADNAMRIIVFGDSLTSGFQLQAEQAFPAQLKKKLEEVGYKNLDVVNMSVDGETTAGAADRINSVLVKKPAVVIVALGNNDMRRGIAPAVINRNLGMILGPLTQNNIYVILAGMKAPPNMEYNYTQQIDAIYPRLAEFYKTQFYPFLLEGVYEKPELNLADGYNPNVQGVAVMVENIYRMVDAGLRWKWEMLQYQRQVDEQMQQMPQPPQ